MEASVRQLLANGKYKMALETAKDFHKAQKTAASEALLLDAYEARIRSLLDQNLTLEAKSLVELVRERFPASRDRLQHIFTVAHAQSGNLSALLEPLNNPQLGSEQRAAIERIIQTEVTDLAALASCDALPAEHPLRVSAAALDKAFNLVASGPVSEEQIALTEVSFRSPLAAWKLLIRAVASFYRGESKECQDALAAIKPESVPARLVPAMKWLLGAEPDRVMKPAESALVFRVSANFSELRLALKNLDSAFNNEYADDGVLYKALRNAVRECQRSAPDLLDELRQIAGVHCLVDGLDERRIHDVLGGALRQDAEYYRMYALGMEASNNEEDLLEACSLWDRFLQKAWQEKRFGASSMETASVYLHMAELLQDVPDHLLVESRRLHTRAGGGAPDTQYFWDAEKLCQRACVIDPETETFKAWMDHALEDRQKEDVAREWNRIRPQDIEPLLFLIEQAEARNAFPTALALVAKAEQLDAVHPSVRNARFRLIVLNVLHHLQKKKPHLAAGKLAIADGLPQAQQGDRPALLSALRELICKASGDKAGAEKALQETTRLMGSKMAALILGYGVTQAAGLPWLLNVPPVKAFSKDERRGLPEAVARSLVISRELELVKMGYPQTYLNEAADQFEKAKESLSLEHVLVLGKFGAATYRPKLAWAASTEGLKRGGPLEARFLVQRADSVPSGHGRRYMALCLAAIQLGRYHRDQEATSWAVERAKDPSGHVPISVTLEQAREVVRRELKWPAFPGSQKGGPKYGDLVVDMPDLCQCADCRRARGDSPLPDDFDPFEDEEDPFDNNFGDDFSLEAAGISDEEMRRVFEKAMPPGIPKELADAMLNLMKEAFRRGESPEKVLDEIFGSMDQKKGKKKR